MFYICFSLLSLPVWALDFFSLSSPIRPKLPSTVQQRKNKWHSDPRRSRSSSWASHSDRIIAIVITVRDASGMGEPLRSDHRHRHRRRRHERHGQATPIIHIVVAVVIAIVIAAPILPISLSLSLGGWLFWLLLVGWFWLMVVGWSGCGCEIWVDIGVWVWVDRVGWFWCLSEFYFFLVAVADIGGRWLICGGGRWLWAVAVDLWCGLLLLLLLLFFFFGKWIIYYFNL